MSLTVDHFAPPCGSASTSDARLSASRIVLDTNVVLDWLVFRNPSCAKLSEHFASGRLFWHASQAMRDELSHVLSRGVCDSWAPDLSALWTMWDTYAIPTELIAPASAATAIRCTDPDDQKFIELALARKVRWLLTRDRAVLKLGRRARTLGLEILIPEDWFSAFNGTTEPNGQIATT